jgi:hypothetical protein
VLAEHPGRRASAPTAMTRTCCRRAGWHAGTLRRPRSAVLVPSPPASCPAR